MARAEEIDGENKASSQCCTHEKVTTPCADGEDDHGCPEDSNCPIQGDHCHHHGICALHGLFLIHSPESCVVPASPDAREFAFEILDFRAGDGPVQKLDKPPLIEQRF